jgi:hypothetical protein
MMPLLGITRYSRFFTSSSLSLFAATWIVILKESGGRNIKGVELYFFWLSLSQMVFIFVVQTRKLLGPRHNILNMIFSFTIAGFMTCFYTWFFWRGLDLLPRSGCSDDYAFFFSRIL